VTNFTPGHSTPGKEPHPLLSRRFDGPQNWSGHLCRKENPLTPAGIRTPDRPVHNLVTKPTPRFLSARKSNTVYLQALFFYTVLIISYSSQLIFLVSKSHVVCRIQISTSLTYNLFILKLSPTNGILHWTKLTEDWITKSNPILRWVCLSLPRQAFPLCRPPKCSLDIYA
jgi:hypothetical protein